MVNASWVYQLSPVVAIEHFDERSLALHCVDLRLVELNATARDLLARLDGQTTLEEVAAAMAADYGQSEEVVRQDVLDVIAQMLELGLVEPVFTAGPTAGQADIPPTP